MSVETSDVGDGYMKIFTTEAQRAQRFSVTSVSSVVKRAGGV